MTIHLAEATIDEQDMLALADWVTGFPRLTKGKLTVEFENKWADWIGTQYATFVNSGSSANLLMLSTLMEAGDLEPGDAVIVPALSWATDLAPVMQLGLVPILCDCNLEDFSVDLGHFESIITDGVVRERDGINIRLRPKAAILVSVLGLLPRMDKIVSICESNKVILLEDCCESLGSAMPDGRKLGTFGAMSTFSTYFGHHISTIEGGMVCTNDARYDMIMRSVRSHGWCRDWSEEDQKTYCDIWGVSDFDAFYTFFHAGYNLRSTDLQAFLGLRQLEKLDEVCMNRWRNFNRYNTYLLDEYRRPNEEAFTSNFAFPIISERRDEIAKALMAKDIECRPLICGSMGKQPFYVKEYGEEELPNAEIVRRYGMYLPNHHLLSDDEIKAVCEVVNA
jgi:CDP-6-deoxy-D-xylo-4-hexulose-3-dehydrase